MINVLVVDDSAVMRKVLSDELSRFGDIRVIGTAIDPYVARDKIVRLRPDVITLDLQMPRMDGLTFLVKLMKHHPLPVVVVSGITTEKSKLAIQALEMGAVEVIKKPKSEEDAYDFSRQLVNAVRAGAKARVKKRPVLQPLPPAPIPVPLSEKLHVHKILAIGASTGGTEAIEAILTRFPSSAPATMIVQHMPEYFTTTFAERLNQICQVRVREAHDNEPLAPGTAYIAPGNHHMLLKNCGDRYIIRIKDGPRVHHQRPSVDVLFKSVAKCAGHECIGVLLTGMGNDGAKGLLEMRRSGAHTIAQDERTSVVFGMPRAAIELKAAIDVLPLHNIAQRILSVLSGRSHSRRKEKSEAINS